MDSYIPNQFKSKFEITQSKMTLQTLLCLATILLEVSSGALLPGPCPNQTKSDVIPEEKSFTVIGKVPFSKYFNSYLFGSRVEESCYVSFQTEGIVSFGEGRKAYPCPAVAGSFERLDASNFLIQTFLTFANVRPTPRPIGLVVNETVNFQLLGHEAILSTCRELPDKDFHDLGVMVLLDYENLVKYFSATKISESVAEMQSAITKYFVKELVDQVQWENEKRDVFCKANPRCTGTIKSLRNEIPKRRYLVIGFVIVVCIIGVLIYVRFPKITCPDNRVSPQQ